MPPDAWSGAGTAGRDGAGRAGDAPGEAVLVVRPEDDGERAVGPLAEVLLQDLPRPLGVGARHRERVREQRREPRRGEGPGDEDGQPAREDECAEAHDTPGPPLQHNGYLPIPAALRRSTVWL